MFYRAWAGVNDCDGAGGQVFWPYITLLWRLETANQTIYVMQVKLLVGDWHESNLTFMVRK